MPNLLPTLALALTLFLAIFGAGWTLSTQLAEEKVAVRALQTSNAQLWQWIQALNAKALTLDSLNKPNATQDNGFTPIPNYINPNSFIISK